MIELKFDKHIFNKGYAIIYTILQWVFVFGFVFFVSVLCLPANTFTIPDSIMPIVCAYLMSAVAGFPVVTLLKKGYRRLISQSKLAYDSNAIHYDKLADKLWTAVGGVEEHHLYSIERVDSISKSRFYYVVKGEIKKVVVNNGRQLEKKNVSSVKIPNAFANMERMMNHG